MRNWTILLIEAGGDETEISDVPGSFIMKQIPINNLEYFTCFP